jgi:hypothetical protein
MNFTDPARSGGLHVLVRPGTRRLLIAAMLVCGVFMSEPLQPPLLLFVGHERGGR